MKPLLLLAILGLFAACSSNPEDTQKGAAVEDRTGTQALSGSNAGSQSSALSGSSLQGSALNNGSVGTSSNSLSGSAGGNAAIGQGQYGLSSALRDPGNLLSKRSVYYEYDSFLVRDEFKAIVEAHVRYLMSNPAARLRLEGNTDERGSREYNLALGQKRSDALKRMMVLMGVPEARIDSVSFGEERPRVEGASEGAYAQNRRSDIAYVGE
ncbi:MAG: peptidoglycan-associated lipoprotein [Pseudomonadota bacterium]|jgi:peptidoglycan-associated lipoprotein